MAQTLAQIRAMLDERGLAPRRALGQNFLIDQNLVRKLADASGLGPGDVALEIGPGTGTLTEELLDRGVRVVAGELDRGLAALLRDRLSGRDFTLVEGDALEGKRALHPALRDALRDATARAGRDRFVLAANLPYGAATPVMTTLLLEHPECASLHVTVQREVADRLLASPGTKDYGPLGVIAGLLGDVSRVANLPPECFWPRPDVTSAMVSIVRRPGPAPVDAPGFAAFVGRLFMQRRKQLGGVLRELAPGADLPAGIEPSVRAESLPLERLIDLYRATRPR